MANLNAMANVGNPYQGLSKKVLCVCSAGLLRSPTAAVVLQREFGFNTRACGINPEYALIPICDLLIHWADEIVVMESWMANEVLEYPLDDHKPVYVLDIPDKFPYMDEELQTMIKESYEAALNGED